jgi:hypothetical protein
MGQDIVLQTSSANFFIAGQNYTISDFMQGVGELLVNVRETGNWQMFGNTVKSMVGFAQASGKALAYLTNGGLSIWIENGGHEKDFYAMLETQSGVQKSTLARYSTAWDGLLQAPDELQQKLLQQPLKNLIALGSAIEQDYVPDKEGWQRLAEAQTYDEFIGTLHEETDLPSRSNRISLEMENGDIYVWSEGRREFVGFLEVSSPSPAVQKAIKRLTNTKMRMKNG